MGAHSSRVECVSSTPEGGPKATAARHKRARDGGGARGARGSPQAEALFLRGMGHFQGERGCAQDHAAASRYFRQAADLTAAHQLTHRCPDQQRRP